MNESQPGGHELRAVRAVIANGLLEGGLANDRAAELAAGIYADYREFVSLLAGALFVDGLTDAARVQKFLTYARDVWLLQRLRSEILRHAGEAGAD